MPSLNRRPFDDSPRRNLNGNIPSAVSVTGRRATPAEAQRRYRAGHRSPHGRSYIDPVWVERRNGLPPFRPYVYRGTGADTYTGEIVQ